MLKITKDIISTASLAKIDYVELVSAEDIHPIEKIAGKALLAVAVFFGKTRLIDNQMFPEDTFI